MTEAAERDVATTGATRQLLSGVAGRWLVIAAMIAVDLIGFRVADIVPDWSSVADPAGLALLFCVYGLILDQVGRRAARFPAVRKFTAFGADLSLSAAQLGLLALASAPLTYILARGDLPLIDPQLLAADHFLGFDWAEMESRVTAYPTLYAVLRWAYFTHIEQSWALITLGSLWYPGRRNGEFIWSFTISLVICCMGSALLPALSMGGETGGYIPVLKSLRAGDPIVLDWGRLQGIVSFPSFHAALGTIYIYAARHRLWALIPFALLDTLLIVATPPMGGHYLTDVIGGIAVALIAIALARRLHPGPAMAAR